MQMLYSFIFACTLMAVAVEARAIDDTKIKSAVVKNKKHAADLALNEVSGRLLRVDEAGKRYHVKVLQSSGRVVIVDVDRQTGTIKLHQQAHKDK